MSLLIRKNLTSRLHIGWREMALKTGHWREVHVFRLPFGYALEFGRSVRRGYL